MTEPTMSRDTVVIDESVQTIRKHKKENLEQETVNRHSMDFFWKIIHDKTKCGFNFFTDYFFKELNADPGIAPFGIFSPDYFKRDLVKLRRKVFGLIICETTVANQSTIGWKVVGEHI